jgi:hypothetical protein
MYAAAYACDNALTGEAFLETVLSDLESKNPHCLANVKLIVEATMTKWSKAYVLKDDRPETEVILGAFFRQSPDNPHDEVGLFLCQPPKTVVRRTFQDSKGYVAAGAGKMIADPLFRILFGELIVPHACLCQISYLMHRAKTDYAVYCGGETDVVLLGIDRERPVWIERLDMKCAEGFADFLDELLKSISLAVMTVGDWSDPRKAFPVAEHVARISLAFHGLNFKSRDKDCQLTL